MGDALTALPLAAWFAMAPVAGGLSSPGPAPTDAPLQEIGRVRVTTPFCKSVLTQALSGISVLLDNDVRIGEAEKTMRQVDADPSPIVRFSRWQELNREYAALRTAAVGGRATMRQLKSALADAPTDDQKKALRALVNALDGALARQNKIGDVVGRLAQYVDNHPPVDDAARDQTQFAAALDPPEAPRALNLSRMNVFATNAPLSTVANRDADDVAERARSLARDEDDAAAKIDAAFSGC